MGKCCVQGRKIIKGQTCRLVTFQISFSLLSTSPEFFYRPEHIFPDLPYTVSQFFMTLALMAVRQEVNNFDSSVVVYQ